MTGLGRSKIGGELDYAPYRFGFVTGLLDDEGLHRYIIRLIISRSSHDVRAGCIYLNLMRSTTVRAGIVRNDWELFTQIIKKKWECLAI